MSALILDQATVRRLLDYDPTTGIFTWKYRDNDKSSFNKCLAGLAERHFKEGETYTMEERQERSSASHSHYFAAVHEAWANLPEHLAERFPTADHLRRWALIKTGWRDERSIVCASKAEAQRVAAFLEPMDSFAVVVVHEATVSVLTAKSQSMKAMGKRDFQKSKDAVLDYLATLIGTTAAEVKQASAA